MNINFKLIDFLTKTNNIKGCSFATIKGYSNRFGEVANHQINLGASLSGAKVKDLKAMQNTTANKLYFSLPNKDTFSYDTFEKAFNELYNSFVRIGDKNIDGTEKVQGNRSKGQINAYSKINSSLKVHNEKERLYIYALRVNKTIIEKGVYPTTNKQAKTVCKDAIKKAMNFKSGKFTMFIVEKADLINATKTQFVGKDLNISLF